MKTLCWLLTHFLLVAFASALQGQRTVPAQLAQADQLHDHGEFRAVIATLEPLLRDQSETLSPIHRGIAWNMLGSAYQNVDNFVEARRCYETSMQILRELPDARNQYASAIDNMGLLEVTMGDLSAAKNLRMKAKKTMKWRTITTDWR